MTEFKPLLIGDVHLADRPPSIRVEGYAEQILEKLVHAGEIALAEGCTHLVQLGDLFHVKTPSKNSHWLVQETYAALRSSGLPVVIVGGNHDVSNDRYESLGRQPLGTLAHMPGITLLTGPHPDLPLFAIPYQHDWPEMLPRWMKQYRAWADERKARDMDFYPLVITHAPIFPAGEEVIYDYIDAADWAELQVNGDCAYGHIHDPHGVHSVPGFGVQFANFGAISRGSLHERTLARKPTVSVWTGATHDPGPYHFYPVELPHLPVERVFRLAEHEDVQERQARVGEFLDSIQATTLVRMGAEEVLDHVRGLGLEPAVVRVIEETLAEVGT